MTVSRRKRAAFVLVGAALTLAAAEGTLQLAAAISPRVAEVLKDKSTVELGLPDPRLGARPNPAFREHDAAGYRNASIPDHVDVVALGDSQTYGVGVGREQAWPQVTQQLSGAVTYQMAFGGFGPVHSLLLFGDAEARRPRVIIEAFYLGNDLNDAFAVVYGFGQLPELRSPDPGTQARIAAAEREETIEAKVHRYFAKMAGVQASSQPAQTSRKAFIRRWPRLSGFIHFVSEHSCLYGLAHAVKNAVRPPPLEPPPDWRSLRDAFVAHPESGGEPLERPGARTILTPNYRFSALDLGDPRIAEGLRIDLEVMRRMHARARADGIDFRVLVIPTKEAVFAEAFADSAPPPGDAMHALAAMEATVRARALEAFAADGIAWLDGRAALAAAVRAGAQPYFITQDGHPNVAGHRALAELVAASLRASSPPSAPGPAPK